jgi:hypothetical protein
MHSWKMHEARWSEFPFSRSKVTTESPREEAQQWFAIVWTDFGPNMDVRFGYEANFWDNGG